MHDEQIIALYWNRDERAISATDETYGGYCRTIAKNILGSAEDAEECVNDTYHHTWNAIPPHKPKLLSAFLGKITRNLSLNQYKKRMADKRGGGELPLVLEELSDCIAHSESVESTVEKTELARAIDDFLEKQPREKRHMFVCRYFYTDSISSIAKRFSKKESAVAMTLARMRETLSEHLRERGY